MQGKYAKINTISTCCDLSLCPQEDHVAVGKLIRRVLCSDKRHCAKFESAEKLNAGDDL